MQKRKELKKSNLKKTNLLNFSFAEIVKSKSCQFPSSSKQSNSQSQQSLWFKNFSSSKASSSINISDENPSRSNLNLDLLQNFNHRDFSDITSSKECSIEEIERLIGAVNFGYGKFEFNDIILTIL